MTDWELMTEIAKANNGGDRKALSELLLANELKGAGVVNIAISSFELTKENVSLYLAAAKKLANAVPPDDFRAGFRHCLLVEMIKEIDSTWTPPTTS